MDSVSVGVHKDYRLCALKVGLIILLQILFSDMDCENLAHA